MNRTNARKVPADAPVGFVRPRWKRFVFADGDIDRRYYEFAVMSELKNALRGGDVWVPGSRQFKDFDEYLLPRDDFNCRQIQGRLGLPVPTSAQAYLDDRLALCAPSSRSPTNSPTPANSPTSRSPSGG